MKLLSDSMIERCWWKAANHKGSTETVSGYSTETEQLIRKTATKQLSESLERLHSGWEAAQSCELPQSLDVATSDGEVLRYILHRGPISFADWASCLGRSKSEWQHIHRRLFACPRDLAAPMTLFVLETGIERQPLLELQVTDLLKGENRARLQYEKRRAKGSEFKDLMVSAEGILSAAGLFQALQKMTESSRLASTVDPALLLQVRSQPRGGARFGPVSEKTLWAYLQKLALRAGMEESLNFSRLRKTQKQPRYLRSKGDLRTFAANHTPGVAGDHYADTAELRSIHEESIAKGLLQALGDSLKAADSPVVDPDLRGSPANGVDEAWLATCTDPLSSPFSPKGEPCHVPLAGCLQCRNAVITEPKLPAIRRLKRLAESQFDAMTSSEWTEQWLVTYVRIRQVLAQFPEVDRGDEDPEDVLFVSPLERFKHV